MIRIAATAATALALLATTAPAGALDISAMSDAERSAFRAEIRAYLMENPEVILEAVEVLEQRQAEAAAAADLVLVAENRDELFDDGYSWVGGNPDGDITIVEFLDYRCAYCRKATPEVERLLAEDGNIRLVVKEYPILGEDSLISSRFAVAVKNVAGSEAYRQAHDALIEYTGELTDVTLRRLAEGLGLEADPILEEMNSSDVTHELARTRELGRRLNISGTPTFVLEDELLRGYLPFEQMAAMVQEKRQN